MQRTSQSPTTSRRARNAAYQRAYRARQRQKDINKFREQQQAQQQQAQQQQQSQQQSPQQQQQHDNQLSQHQSPQQQQQHQHDNQLSQLQPNDQNIIEMQYENYVHHLNAHKQFKLKMIDNDFGYACAVCDRLWFQNDLKAMPAGCENLINEHFDTFNFVNAKICATCHSSLNKNKIPPLSTSNGFKYPTRPVHLPHLDIVTERLISPRLPFMQIRRLRHGQGQYGILGQIINVPVSINNMVRALPRNIDNDYAINVHIKRKLIHKSSYIMGMVKKSVIKTWLQYLLDSPMFKFYNITIDNSFFTNDNSLRIPNNNNVDQFSEVIEIEEALHAQQQTLLWNEDNYLCLAPGENNIPISILFDEHSEELSFPSIYLGQFRSFKEGLVVTPFMIASSELRRSDRRGVTPSHVLYMAMKIMRLRIRDSITIAFKYIGLNTNITRADIQNQNFVHGCIDKNLAFLRSIPNSVYYWSQRKRDLFAMIRQLGKPTFFLTMSANEIGWPKLMRLLYKLKNNGCDINITELKKMHFNDKSKLVNEDPVTCAIYFNKLVNTIMNILQSPRCSPFGNNYVKHYFQRIEFQHRGSPHAHILLWLNDAPENALGGNLSQAEQLINKLVSVKSSNASGYVKLQTHKHTFTCRKTTNNRSKAKNCRFGAPFMPSKSTIILTPMPVTDSRRTTFTKIYMRMWNSLEENEFENMDTFLTSHNITSYDTYLNVLTAGITRPMVFLKRETYEKWINPFNPFIFNVLKSNMDIQFITEEYSCAAYVVEYVNKTNRGISNLQQNILKTMDEHPEFDIIEITRQLSINLLNSVEITSQEAAWYLLRQPMSRSSVKIIYIPTSWPTERERIRKTNAALDAAEIDGDSCDIWKENIFDKYEKRPLELENITLAQFAANYTYYKKQWIKRKDPRIIRYRNYDMEGENNNYKREMVTLYLPFRSEENDILAEHKYIQLYDTNDVVIMQARHEFESSLDIAKTLEICRALCIEHDADQQIAEDLTDFATRAVNRDTVDILLQDPNADINADIRSATLSHLGSIVRKRDNIMPREEFNALMRQTNERQRGLLLHVIHHILIDPNTDKDAIQIFLTGPAGCGKTFIIHLLKDIYNRFTNVQMPFNAFLTCASTGKAAVSIEGTTIHTAFKISIARQSALSFETLQQYRSYFKFICSIIIDEISMVSAELNAKIDSRLKQITGLDRTYGGKDIYLIGDLRQLPPVRATPIYKQLRDSLAGPTLWRSLKYYELSEVMRQANEEFANLLTKVGNGETLSESQQLMIESRFFTKQAADELCSSGIRLFFKNEDVLQYNQSVLSLDLTKVISLADDCFSGHHNAEQLAFCRQKLHKLPILETGGLPYEITLVINKPYLITTNIDVSDGLANGAIGILTFIEYANNLPNDGLENEADPIIRLWFKFPNTKIGAKIVRKSAHHATTLNIARGLIPISHRRSTTFLNNNRTIVVKRNHFPIIPACGMTIHKSQGATFNEVVYNYDKKHDQQLVYVALSRVTAIEGLFIVAPQDQHVFHHGRRPTKNLDSLRQEFARLSTNTLTTVQDNALQFLQSSNATSLMTFNCQSLSAHNIDLQDVVTRNCDILLLTETWLENDTTISINSFECCNMYKRLAQRSGGVAIYRNIENNRTIHSHPNITLTLSSSLSSGTERIGDVCCTEFKLSSGLKLHCIAVYISPNQTVSNVIKFLHYTLLPYTEAGARELRNNFHSMPLILGGDFNVNFAETEALPLIKFLFDVFNLTMNNRADIATTNKSTTIDAVFSRFLNSIESMVYISYFSYHKPILTIAT